jgi:hypothetical protein
VKSEWKIVGARVNCRIGRTQTLPLFYLRGVGMDYGGEPIIIGKGEMYWRLLEHFLSQYW